MKETFKKVLSFMMAMLMVLQVMAPVAVLAIGEDETPKQLSFTDYEIDDNTYFEYVPKDEATLIDDAKDEIQVRLATDDVENIKLIVGKDYALFDDATYDNKEDVQEQFDELEAMLEEQGLKLDAKVVEVPGKDGEEPSYKIRNNVNVDIFMEENDLDEDFKDHYNVYFLTTLDGSEADDAVENDDAEPQTYDFVLAKKPASKAEKPEEEKSAEYDAFLAAIVNVDRYNVYTRDEFGEERKDDVQRERQEAEEAQKDAKKPAGKHSKTEITTDTADGRDGEKKADAKDAAHKIEEKDAKKQADDKKEEANDATELELGEEQTPMAVRANGTPEIVDGKNFQLKAPLTIKATRTLPVPAGWYVDVYVGDYLKDDPNHPIKALYNGNFKIADGAYVENEHKIRYTINQTLTSDVTLNIDQLLAFDMDNIVKDYGNDPSEFSVKISVRPKNLSSQDNEPVVVRKGDPRTTITSEFVIGGENNIGAVTYPYKLEVSSSQTPRDENGNVVTSITGLAADLYVWWDFEVDLSPLQDQAVLDGFNRLNISLYGSAKQGLGNFQYKVSTSPIDDNDTTGFITSGLTGPELMTGQTFISKANLTGKDKLYIRVKAPIGVDHETYSMGLRINPDSNYVQKIVNDFIDQFNRLPFILKYMKGVDEARQIASTPFNLVDGMYTAKIGLQNTQYKENYYYDNSRTVVANRINDTTNEWYALDLLRLGEEEDPNLENAKLNPDTTGFQKLYFVPYIGGGYTRTSSETLATMPDPDHWNRKMFKPGVIVSYKFYNQKGREETSYNFNADLRSKKTDFIFQIENAPNAPTEGGSVHLFNQKVITNPNDPSGNGFLSYMEYPYYIMRINKTFEMVQCFNADKKDPTLTGDPNGLYLDQHINPSGDYLLTRLNKSSTLPDKLEPGSTLNPKKLSKGEAMEDLLKRVYFYADREKENYAKTHGGAVMHRAIEAGMLQKVIHYLTDDKSIEFDYFSSNEANFNLEDWRDNATLRGGKIAGTNEWDLEKAFRGEKGVNTDPETGIRRLSEGEEPLGRTPFIRDEQMRYGQNVLRNVLNSYNNSAWEDEHKADSVQLVFYSHTENKQELITGHVTKPITIDKVNSEGKKISEAQFRLVNKKTGEVYDWTSSENSQDNLQYLKEGEYIVQETKAPAGYDTLPAFTLKIEREEINPDDGPFGYYKLLNKKKGIHVNDGYKTVVKLGKDIPKGPDGKDLVTVEDGKINVEISDPKSNLGEIEFTKKSIENKDKDRALDGAEFTLTKVKSDKDWTPEKKIDGTSVYLKRSTGNFGLFKFKQMPEGYYVLRETKAPEGYKKVSEKVIYVTPTDGSDKLVAKFLGVDGDESLIEKDGNYTLTNEPIKTDIPFIKTNGATTANEKLELPGAKFRLYSTSIIGNKVYDEVVFSGNNGEFQFKDLVKGEYVLEELVPPEGYQLPKDLENEKDRFFGWKIVVDQVEGKEALEYKIYKLKTRDDASKPAKELEEVDTKNHGLIEIANAGRTIDVEFQKYIENPNFNDTIDESTTNPRYIPIDTDKLTREDGTPVSFDLYKSDFYGAKIDNDPATPEVDPVYKGVTSDKNGVFHLKGLKFNGYYILEETAPPDGYGKANPIVLRVVAEALTTEGEMKVIVRDPNINALMKNGNTFKGVVDFKENERPGKVAVKKTGNSLDKEHPGEVGLRRAYFRLYFADERFEKTVNSEGYPEYIQKVTEGKPLTHDRVDENGDPIIGDNGYPIQDITDVTELPENQGIAVFDQLKPGFYILEEYRGPAGYIKDPNPRYIEVRSDGTVVKSLDKNDPNFSNADIPKAVQADGKQASQNGSFFKRAKEKIVNLFDFGNEPKRPLARAAGDTGDLARISVTGSDIDTTNGSRDVNMKIIPNIMTKDLEHTLHMLVMIDRSESNQDTSGKVSVDDNINKFLNDFNKKAQETNADVDITFVEYSSAGSKNLGTYSLKELNQQAREYNYYYAWFADYGLDGGSVGSVDTPERIKNYLDAVKVSGFTRNHLDGSDKVKANINTYLNDIQDATDNKTYDAKIAVNFAKFYPQSLKTSANGYGYDILDNMKTLQDEGYDTWTYHSDLRLAYWWQLPPVTQKYKEAADRLVAESGGKAHFEYRFANRKYQEDDAAAAPYIQKPMMDELIQNSDYFGTKNIMRISKVQDATFTVRLKPSIGAENDQFTIKKYRGTEYLGTVKGSLTKDSRNGDLLTIKNLTLEEGEYLTVDFKAKLAASVDATQSFPIFDNIELSTAENEDLGTTAQTQRVVSTLDLYKEQTSTALGKPTGDGNIEVNFKYNNYPAMEIPKDEQGKDKPVGTIKLQWKVKDEWYDLRETNQYGDVTDVLLSENAPFEGKVSFEKLDPKQEYRLVYRRSSPYFSNWGESEVSYYKVEFKDKGATIDISNGNLLKIFNEDEDGFRIPLRITKMNDNKTVLEGSSFKARKIINGEEIASGKYEGQKPKYADEDFDAVSEATGLAGDNYFRELTPGIYELWEEKAPDGYKQLKDKWYFKVTVNPDKEPGDADYMVMDFQFKYDLPKDINDSVYNQGYRDYYNNHATEEEKKLPGTTIYGLDYGNKGDSQVKPGEYDKFIQNIELVPDDGRSNPARPDAPYKTIDDAHVYNHKETGELIFNKVNSAGKSIDGAEFTLTKIKADKDGNPILNNGKPDPELIEETGRNVYKKYSTSSLATGVRFEDILEGTYALEEISPAPGYKKIDSYLVIKFTENEKGEIIQEVDRDHTPKDSEFLGLINTSDKKLQSVENEDHLTDFEFIKTNADGEPVLSTVFTLEEVDKDGKPVLNGYNKTLTGYYSAKFKFEGLKEGRYKLTETPNANYEKPAPWYFDVVLDQDDGKLTIQFENENIKDGKGSIRFGPVEDADGHEIFNGYQIVNYKKTNFSFNKVVKGPETPERPISEIWFNLKKVRTEPGKNGEQIYDDTWTLNKGMEAYAYNEYARSDRDGSVFFDGLSSGVYQLTEVTKLPSLKNDVQDRWIIKVVKEDGKLKVVYDKNDEESYYEENDKDYYKTYMDRGYNQSTLFEQDQKGDYKLTNLIDGIDIKWKKVDAKYGAVIEKAMDFKFYQISDDPDKLSDLNIFAQLPTGEGEEQPPLPEGVADLTDKLNNYQGRFEVQGLKEGLYKIVETKAPEDYKPAERSFLAQVKEGATGDLDVRYYEIDGQTLIKEPEEFNYIKVDEQNSVVFDDQNYIDIKNTLDKTTGTLKIDKKDNQGRPLAGARFALLGENGETVKEVESDKSGKAVFIDIAPGSYTLIESVPPAGYETTNKIWSVYVASDGKTFIHELGDIAPDPGTDEGQNVTDKVKLDTAKSSINFNDNGSGGGIANNGRLEMDTGEDVITVKMHLDVEGEVNPGDYFIINESDTLHYNMLQPDKPNYPNIVDSDGTVLARWAYGPNFDPEKGSGKDIYYVFTDAVEGKKNIAMNLTWGHSVNRNFAPRSGSYKFSARVGKTNVFNNIEIAYMPFSKDQTKQLSINTNYLYTNDESGQYTQIAYINPMGNDFSKIDGQNAKILIYPAVQSGMFNMADIDARKTKVSLYKVDADPSSPDPAKKLPDTVIFDESKLTRVDPSKYDLMFIGKNEGGQLVNAAELTFKEPLGSDIYLVKVDSEMVYPKDSGASTLLGQYVEFKMTIDNKDTYVKKSNGILTNGSGAEGHGDNDYTPPSVDVINRRYVDKKGRFELIKTDPLGANLPGAEFTLMPISPAGDAIVRTSATDGKIIFDNLDPGTYKLEETKAPQGFVEKEGPWTVTVDQNGITKVVKAEGVLAQARLGLSEFFGKVQAAPEPFGGNGVRTGSKTAPASADKRQTSEAEKPSALRALPGGTRNEDVTIKNTGDTDAGNAVVTTNAEYLGNNQFRVRADVKLKDDVKEENVDVVIVLSTQHLYDEGDPLKTVLINKINAYGDNVRVGLVTYGGIIKKISPTNDKQTVINAIRDYTNRDNNNPTEGQVATAFNTAKTYLSQSTADKKEVINLATSTVYTNMTLKNAIAAIGKENIHSYYRSYPASTSSVVSSWQRWQGITMQDASYGNEGILTSTLPSYTPIDMGTFSVSFNDNFKFDGGSTSTNKSDNSGQWHSSYNASTKTIDLRPGELTLKKGQTATMTFTVTATGDIQPETAYDLINGIKFAENKKATEKTIAPPTVFVERPIEQIDVTVASRFDGPTDTTGNITFDLMRKPKGETGREVVEHGSISLNGSKTFKVDKTTEDLQTEYEYYVANVSSSDEKIIVTANDDTVAGQNGTLTIVSRPREKFKVDVDWGGLSKEGTITAILSNGESITIDPDGIETDKYDPKTTTIEKVSINNDQYNVTVTGTDGKSPYMINVTEKSVFVVALDWGNLEPIDTVVATLTDGTELRFTDGDEFKSLEGIAPDTTIREVHFSNEDNDKDYDFEIDGDKSPYTIKVMRKAELPSLTVKNDKSPRGHFQIKKTDENGDKVLEGAVFILKDKDGREVKRASSDRDGLANFTDLLEGDYTLEEIKAPEDYLKTDTIWKVKVDKDGKVTVTKTVPEETQTNLINSINNPLVARQYTDGNGNPVVNFATEIVKSGEKYYLKIKFIKLSDNNYTDALNIQFNTEDFKVLRDGTEISRVNETFYPYHNQRYYNYDNDGRLYYYDEGEYTFEISLRDDTFEGNTRAVSPIKSFVYEGKRLEERYIATITQTETTTTTPEHDETLATGSDVEFSVANKQKPRAEITLHKIDGVSFKDLQDVEFKLTKIDEEGRPVYGATPITGKTDENGSLTFSEVAQGRYKLEEVTALDGYYNILIDFIVRVDENGQASYSRILKKPVDPKLVKTNSTKEVSYQVESLPHGLPLPDYHVKLYSDTTEGVLGSSAMNQASGTLERKQDPVRNYYVQLEFDDPSEADNWDVSYIKTRNNKVQIIAYNKNVAEQLGKDDVIAIRNFPEQDGSTKFQIVKTDDASKKPIKGVVFNIKSSNGYNKNFTTDANGQITVDKIPNGIYEVVEVKTPDGYVLDETPRQIIVGGNYTVPEGVDGNNVTDWVKFDGDTVIRASEESGNAYDPILVKTNDSEGFNIRSKYKFVVPEGNEIKPGDFFYLDVSKNMNTWGIFSPEYAYDLNLVGPLGLLAKGQFVENYDGNGNNAIKYTFTDYLDNQKAESASSLVSYFTEENVVKDDGVITVSTGLGKDVRKHQVEVYYSPTTYYGFKWPVNSINRMQQTDWVEGTYKNIIYVNRYRESLANAVLEFGDDAVVGGGNPSGTQLIKKITPDQVRIYKARGDVDVSMPKSFGLENNETESLLTDVTGSFRNSMSISYNGKLTINFGNAMYDRSSYIVVINGTFDNAQIDKPLRSRQLLTATGYFPNWGGWYQDTGPSGTYNDPYENASEADGEIKLSVTNAENKVEYIKQDKEEKPLAGAIFELRKKNDQGEFEKVKDTVKTDKDGLVVWTDLMAGDYEVWEMKAPDGYEPVPEGGKLVKKFAVDETKHIIKYPEDESNTIVNKKNPAELEIVKKDFDGDKPLSGAKFNLYRQKAGFGDEDIKFDEKDTVNFEKVTVDEQEEFTTDKDGKIVFKNIEDGVYFLKEVRAPEGYANIPRSIGPIAIVDGTVQIPAENPPTKDDDMYTISTSSAEDDGKTTNTVTVYNRKAIFPNTGGFGPLFIILAGALIMATSW
ncbi:MAG: SpaA isopeptide-forming pilin-related protein, partial [Firmicutes bacterium]|nr:SpaA isopeptide-forming pilin-related protein [Bacillota bacterium]